MENPQAQMPQGQPGMEQGQAPQQGGQDQQMQQLMQMVQQMIQQGAQPTDVAAELLGQQVPPEAIMQVFVELGLPEQEAQMAIEQAMQGGQQQQGPGEEQMEGAASNPQEEAVEGQGAPMMPPGMEGQPPMAFGGQPRRMLRQRAEGGGMDPQQELQSVIEQVQGMMEQGADARQVMEQIQAAAQQGQISPEVATQVMEQLSGMQETANPQGSDMAMTEGSQDPQAPSPEVAAPEAQMMKFGGNLKKLMQKAYGGNAIPPSLDSKNYAQERTNMFVTSVKNNAFKSSLDDEFPSLSGNQMAYGGNLPKAVDGFDVTKYKTADEAELAARRYYDSLDAEKQKTFDWKTESGKWKEPEMKYEAGKSYQLDPATGKLKVAETPKTNQFQFQEGDVLNKDAQGAYVTRKDGSMMRVPANFGNQNQTAGSNVSQSQLNPVAYQDPRGNSLMDQLYMSANPWARLIAGSGNRGYDPRITGTNLPGGMSGADFLGNVGGLQGLTTGMTGKVGDQTWRVTGAEKFKEGSIWKGNRRKGVRYNIDWGSASAMNPNANTNQPQQPAVNNTTPSAPVNPSITSSAPGSPVLGPNNQPLTSDGSNMMWNSGNMPTLQNPNPVTNANQTLVNPANSDVVQPGSEVNAADNAALNSDQGSTFRLPGQTDEDVQRTMDEINQEIQNNPINAPEEKQNLEGLKGSTQRKIGRAERRLARQVERGKNLPQDFSPSVSNPAAKAPVNPSVASGNRGPEVSGVTPNVAWQSDPNAKPWEKTPAKPVINVQPPNAPVNPDITLGNRGPEISGATNVAFANGGAINPQDLANAIALINRAFGGMIPRANNGLDLGSEDTDANKIPDYLQAENLPAKEPNPFTNKSSLEASEGKKFNVNWGAVSDIYETSGPKFANFMNGVSSFAGDEERELAKRSALNRPVDDYSTMSQGVYDQWGNFIPNKVNNQTLNPTDVYRQNQRQVYAYGGRLYEIGGEVELDDNELAELSAAGFNFRRS